MIKFCMLLLAVGAAYETYDDNRAFVMDPEDLNYNEDAYDYLDVAPYRPVIPDPVQNMILYQLFNSLQNKDDARLRMQYRPKFSTIEAPVVGYGHVPYSELMDFKGAVAKRHAEAPAARAAVPKGTEGHKLMAPNQKQPKLTKNGFRSAT